MFSINGIIFSLFLLNHLNNPVFCNNSGNTFNPGSNIPNLKNEKFSSIFKWLNESLDECRRSLDSLVDIETLKEMLNDVYYIDEPISLKGDLTFDFLTISDTLKAPDVRSQDGTSHGEKFDSKFQTIANSLSNIEDKVVELDNLLENAMKTNGNQEVSGNITFANAYLNCGDEGCNIKSIETSTFNGRKVDRLSDRVICLNKDQDLADHFNFSHLIVGDINVSFINSISPADIVTRNGDQKISGDVTFEDSVRVNQLDVIETVNGHKINRQTVLTTNDDQVIISPVSFTHDITVKDLNVYGHLSQIGSDVNSFLSNIVQIDRNHTITGKKIFNDVIVDNLAIEGGTLNGFNLTDLSRHLLTRDDPQTINAIVKVDELVVKGNIHVDRINGKKLEEIIVRRNEPTVIRGDKVFTGPVYIKSMQVDDNLNGRPIINRSLGLMLRKGRQVITGHKEFIDIEVKNVTLFHGNVGPLSFELLENKMNRMIKGGKKRVLSGPIQLEDIKVEGSINGINLTSLKNDYLAIHQTIIPSVNLHIARANFMKPLRCNRINGLKFPDDFITKNTRQFIPGNTHISSNLVITSNLNITRVNNYDVGAALWDSLRFSSDQVITVPKTIKGNLFIGNLNVTSLNNIKMEDLVLLNGKGIILGNKTFSSIKVVGQSSVNSINGVKTINRIAVDELFSNSIRKRNYQSISSNIHVKKLVIPLGTNVNINELAGVKLNDILSSVVYLRSNSTQVIRGKKRFTSRVKFGNLEFLSTFAGYSRNDFSKNYLNRSSSEINADISIDSDLFIENELIVTGRVNELNIKSLSGHLPVNGKPLLINRPMNFRHVRIIGGNVAAPTFNGLKFSQEMITKKSTINFVGDASFLHGVTINNLTVGSINNVTIGGSVCNPIQHVFSKPYSLTITGNVAAQSAMQSKTINRQTFNPETTNLIKGNKRFKKLNIKGAIHLKGRLNDFDMKYLQQTYLSRTKNQTIDSEVILRNATFSGPVYIGGHLSGRNVFTNGVDIAKVASANVRRTGNQNIEGTFYFPGRVIFRKGLVNSPLVTLHKTTVNLTRDAFLKSQSNEVYSKMVFNNVYTDDLKTYERTNLYRDLTSLNSSTQFYGLKNFTSLEIDDLVVDYINGIPVASLLRSDADANINGTLAVNSDLMVKSNLSVFGKVNGIKLQLLGSKLVLIGGNNTIEAPLTLKYKPTVRSLEVPGPWRRQVSEYLRELSIPKKLKSLNWKLAFNRGRLRAIERYLEKQKSAVAMTPTSK